MIIKMYSTHVSYTLKRLIHFRSQLSKNFEWVQPSGQKTDVVVYNTIAKTKTPLVLRNNNNITWYICGPTVYDSSHIGHACTYVRLDIIRRILTEFFNINVVTVMGITNIDDKIINKSNESRQCWKTMAQHYENEFFSDMDSLNILRPYTTCKVTNYIPEIVEFVKTIFDKNGAYVGNDGSVYFDTSKYEHYGKFNIPLISEYNENKRSSVDFSLWKAAKENEPCWESPWGLGRPGWHIECSTMASTILGKNIDMHSGGIDLAFPHHENEEAQSCCYHDKNQWVNYWLHTGLLHLTEDIKMSKSLQNTISIPSLFETCTANEFRMMCLTIDYKKNLLFSNDAINKAKSLLNKIDFFIADCNTYVSGRYDTVDVNASQLLQCLEKTKKNIYCALANDFNTSQAINEIINLIHIGNKIIKTEKAGTAARNPESVAAVANYLQCFISKLGISPLITAASNRDITEILNIFTDFRNNVRIAALEKEVQNIKLLKICDELRNDLSKYGMGIRDQKKKSCWKLR